MNEFPELANATLTFGLMPKKRARVTELLAEGKTWEEIGRDVGWEPKTLREYYERGEK